MRYYEGDIWDLSATHWLCIPTNLGWTTKGLNVMGAGVAKQAASKHPRLPLRYGVFCRMNPGKVKIYPYKDRDTWLLMCPTKPLNADAPHLSWKHSANLGLVERTIVELERFSRDADRPICLHTLNICLTEDSYGRRWWG
jgi:hypothetical protein